MGVLLDGGFGDKNGRSLGWMIREKVSHEVNMIKKSRLWV